MNYSSLQASSAASVSSNASTVRASNRDTTTLRFNSLLSNMANPSIPLTDSQKASFYAVWDDISDMQKSCMAQYLQKLVGVQSLVGDGGDQGAKSEMLGELDYLLRYNASAEHAANMSEFMTDLAILSSEAVLEMHSMTVPGPTAFVIHAAAVVQEGNRHDVEERSVSSIATSTAAIVASSASSVASNAASTASTLANSVVSAASTLSSAASTASTLANSVVSAASTLSSAASTATTVASTTTSESIASL